VANEEQSNHVEGTLSVLTAVDKISRIRFKNHEEILQWSPAVTPSHATDEDRKRLGPNVKLISVRYSKIDEK
jgi:hypothetical protein